MNAYIVLTDCDDFFYLKSHLFHFRLIDWPNIVVGGFGNMRDFVAIAIIVFEEDQIIFEAVQLNSLQA